MNLGIFKVCMASVGMALVIATSSIQVGSEMETCRQGYVWHRALPGDQACVTPETRAPAARDNRQANARQQSGGGAFSPPTHTQTAIDTWEATGRHVTAPEEGCTTDMECQGHRLCAMGTCVAQAEPAMLIRKEKSPCDLTVVGRRILPNGEVELRFSDGEMQRIHPNGQVTLIHPDGSQELRYPQIAAQQTRPVALPPPPSSDSVDAAWLHQHAERLLEMIVSLAPDQRTARADYLQFEAAGTTRTLYERIERRTQTITTLIRGR